MGAESGAACTGETGAALAICCEPPWDEPWSMRAEDWKGEEPKSENRLTSDEQPARSAEAKPASIRRDAQRVITERLN